jgi:3-oxoacyl-[acyl-carrier-protein] synthase I
LVLLDGAEAVVVVGVESFLRQAIVNHYVDAGRLLCGTNSNGFVPGEAACAILLAPVGDKQIPCLEIMGIGLEQEKLAVKGMAGQATRGEAMTRAWRRALTQANVHFYDVAFTVSDLNGERFKFKEAAFAAARLDRVPPEGRSRRAKGFVQMWHPCEYLGEIGAAISPCLLGWTYEAGMKGYLPSLHAMLHASEDEGERMAIVTRFNSGDNLR